MEFLLKTPIANAGDLAAVTATAKESQAFLSELEQRAGELGMLRGKLSRCLLPYSENTSTLDQANVAVGGEGVYGYEESASMLDGKINQADVQRLTTSAVAMRQLMRVKLADDADLDQAARALAELVQFNTMLEVRASERGLDTYALLKTL
jgi:hypothetical protein